MAQWLAIYLGISLTLFVDALAFVYPFTLIKVWSSTDTARIFNRIVAVIAGTAFTHWLVRMPSFLRGLMQASSIQKTPGLGDAIVPAGVLAVYLLRATARIPRYRKDTPTQRLSKAQYVTLLGLASTYGVVESIVAGCYMKMEDSIVETTGNYYLSFFVSELLTSAVLGTLSLKARCNLAGVIKAGAAFLATTLLGLSLGLSLDRNLAGPTAKAVLATIAGLASGAYFAEFFGSVVLVEVRKEGGMRCFALGAIACLCAVCIGASR